MIVHTYYGTPLKVLGAGSLPGMISVETPDLWKTEVLVADVREPLEDLRPIFQLSNPGSAGWDLV